MAHSRSYDEDEGFQKQDTLGQRGRRACRACTDFQSYIKRKDNKKPPTPETSASQQVNDGVRNDCPLDSFDLGHNTWSLLHSMAAYYPKKPTEAQQKDMTDFVKTFAKFYPCKPCAKDLRKDLETNQPDVRDRYTFSDWMCRLHNRVNKKLNKPQFDCSLVMQRWKDGWKDGSCD